MQYEPPPPTHPLDHQGSSDRSRLWSADILYFLSAVVGGDRMWLVRRPLYESQRVPLDLPLDPGLLHPRYQKGNAMTTGAAPLTTELDLQTFFSFKK